ncbi:TFDP1 family protein [Megaselia abdita]
MAGQQQLRYFVSGEHDSYLSEIKEEPSGSYTVETALTGFPSETGAQYISIENEYPVSQTGSSTYTVVTTSQQQAHTIGRQNTSAKNLNQQHSNIIKNPKIPKFISGSGELQNIAASQKSKLHSVQSNMSTSRRRKPEKAGRGLRHFSMRVCEKVKEKGKTTYNEVADELVKEEFKEDSANCDQKNIRRRVYDALNVLMAINIISKDKKEIRWLGLPTNPTEQYNDLTEENRQRRESCEAKQQQIEELLLQLISFKKLIERNKDAESQGIIPTANSTIPLPFIIVNTNKSTKVNCSVTNDKSEYFFKFDDEFEINDDVVVLKRMGLLAGLDKGECSPENIESAKALVPHAYGKYIEALGRGISVDEIEQEEIHDWNAGTSTSFGAMSDSQMNNLTFQSYIEEDDRISDGGSDLE